MTSPFNRRDFLKLAGSLPLGYAASRMTRSLGAPTLFQTGKQNVLVVIFDAWSAHNVPIYGYPRETTPNLSRLAERAIVYHNHHAGGNFTTPGTASLLTGALPWTHRAFTLNSKVAAPFAERNIFRAFEGFHRIAYTHNNVANTLLKQFEADIEDLVPREDLYLTSDKTISNLFQNDDDASSVAWVRTIKKGGGGYAYSLFLSRLYEYLQLSRLKNLKQEYPRGLPGVNGDNYFLLEQAVDALGARLKKISQPFFGYFHFLPPHYPYRPPLEFFGRFANDNYQPVEKPADAFRLDRSSDSDTDGEHLSALENRRYYDEFVLYVDREFGRFFDNLESMGLLDNTWVVLTSDHGEMFERGIVGHSTAVLYEPVVHVPMMIFEPGRTERLDVHTPTSAADLLPTLLHLSGQNPAAWTEGLVLPPFADPSPERSVYAVQARGTQQDAPIQQATVSLVKGKYKLMYFFGYQRLGADRVELYDLEADPEELHDLVETQQDVAAEMLAEVKAKLAEVNQPYIK
jgi:arylsulfatase A-like enzyme